MHHLLLCLLISMGLLFGGGVSTQQDKGITGIVYVYTMSLDVCNDMKGMGLYHFPSYIAQVLNQAIFTQQNDNNTKVLFISNYKECPAIEAKIIREVKNYYLRNIATYRASVGLETKGEGEGSHIEFIDTSKLLSTRTSNFLSASANIFMDTHGSLWIAAAARFFWLEDLMKSRGYAELIHVEADNLLYSPLGPLLPSLRKHYKQGLAVTPMDANRSGLTASFVWISSLASLTHFNDYFLDLASANHTTWTGYLAWLRRYACCRKGSGIAEDAHGNGIKPFKVNEMTVLAYYANLYFSLSTYLHLFPIVPTYPYYQNRYTANSSHYAPNSELAGSSLYVLDTHASTTTTAAADITGGAADVSSIAASSAVNWEDRVAPADAYGSLLDPGSWGQFLGGTNMQRGTDKKFRDSSHIVGQAVSINHCVAEMRCGNTNGIHFFALKTNKDRGEKEKYQCFMAPFVRCGTMAENNGSQLTAWHPLVQLHVHAKFMNNYISVTHPCDC